MKESRASGTLGCGDLQAVIVRARPCIDNRDFLTIGIETRSSHRAGTRLTYAYLLNSPALSRISIQPFVKSCAHVAGVGQLEKKILADLTFKAKGEILSLWLPEIRRNGHLGGSIRIGGTWTTRSY